jgi:hypothetical protein
VEISQDSPRDREGVTVSAWRIGRGSGVRTQQLAVADEPTFKSFIDKLTKWIPGDILALYVASVTALKGASSTSVPNVGLLIGFAILTPIVIWLGAWKAQPAVSALGMKLLLGTLAFLVWSLSIPFSGWQRIDWIAKSPQAVAIVAAVVGLLYGIAADTIAGGP